jgi:hypothetical protein
MQYIAFDVHKHYTWARVEAVDGRLVGERKAVHRPGALRAFLEQAEPGNPVAMETVGNWYWVVEEVEEAGCVPQLVAADAGRGEQDGPAGLPGDDPAAAGGDVAGGVDPTATDAGHHPQHAKQGWGPGGGADRTCSARRGAS